MTIKVDIIATTEAVVGDREQAIGIRWQVDTSDCTFLREHGIDQSRSLVTEAIMVIAPAGRGQQNVERGDRFTPGQFDAFLKPLGMLDRHRSRDQREGFVGSKETMATSEQVAFEPAVAEMLAEHFQYASIG